jgi:hypothetical protein
MPQVWTPQENVDREQSQARFATAIAHHAGIAMTLTASGERVEATAADDPHYTILSRLLEKYGHPKSQEALNTMGKAEGLEDVARQTMQLLYAKKYKSLPSVPDEQAMTFPPTTQAKKKQDEQGMTFQPGVTMSKKKPAADMEARAKVARDIQATLAQVRALSAGTSPAAAVRAPVRPQRRGLDMVAMARVFAAFVQSQGSDTSVRHEIAAARREVEALKQRVAADREARRLTGRV